MRLYSAVTDIPITLDFVYGDVDGGCEHRVLNIACYPVAYNIITELEFYLIPNRELRLDVVGQQYILIRQISCNDAQAVYLSALFIASEKELERRPVIILISGISVLCIYEIRTALFMLLYADIFRQEIVQAVLQDSDDGGTNTYHGNIIGGDLNGETGSDYESEKESS